MAEPWETGVNPFNNTRTGYLGKHRPEMLTNEILLKDIVGKPKLRGRIVPANFTHGESYRCPWTAAQALRNWEGTLPPVKAVKKNKTKLQTDYMQLNRAALSAGMLTAKEVRSFRKTKKPVKFKHAAADPNDPGKALERPPAKKFTWDQLFGAPLRRDPPIWDTLTNLYQKQWLLGNKKTHIEMKNKKPDFTLVKPNRASLIRSYMPETGVQEPPWRLPQFVNKAKPHLSTFRSESAKMAAFAARQDDAQGRHGQRGQGVERLNYHAHPLPPIKAPQKCPPGAGAKAWSFCDE